LARLGLGYFEGGLGRLDPRLRASALGLGGFLGRLRLADLGLGQGNGSFGRGDLF
jgi:hypothetical protein